MNEHLKTASDLKNCTDYRTDYFSYPDWADLEIFRTIDGELVAMAITPTEGSGFIPKSTDNCEVFDKVNNTYYLKRVA